MRYISFHKTCKKCGREFEVKVPAEEFEKVMKERKIGDMSYFKGVCDNCK